jgi:predicted component of type VI protein secretion system
MVNVAVPALVPLMLTGVVEPKLKVGRSWAPAGLEVTVAVSATLPVKPPAGVSVMVDAFAAVAPGVTETAVPLTVKLALTVEVTVTELDPDALL